MATATLDDVNTVVKKMGGVSRGDQDAGATTAGISDQDLQKLIRSVEAIQWLDWVKSVVRDDSFLFEMATALRRFDQTKTNGDGTTSAAVEKAREEWAVSMKDGWDITQDALRNVQIVEDGCRRLMKIRRIGPRNISDLREVRSIIADFMRALRLTYPDLDFGLADFAIEDYSTIYVPPLGYLKSVWAIAWNAFRHPFSETVINLQTGEVMPCE
jgi:hypothetical protein